MMKPILLTVLLSFTALTQLVFAEASKELSSPSIDMSAANKAHAFIAKSTDKEESLWSKDQLKQSELEKKYKEEINRHPDSKKTYAYLAGLYLINNKTTQAIEAYQDAITHDSKNPKLFAALSIAYLHHAKYDMAKAMAEEALRLNPNLKGVKKINEYVVAKKEVIEVASKIPAGGSKYEMSGQAPHGGIMPTAVGSKPTDLLHSMKK